MSVDDYNDARNKWAIPTIKTGGGVASFESYLGGVFLSKDSRQLMIKYQNEIVSEIMIGIQPVGKVIEFLLNLSTKGEMEDVMKKLNIEGLIHPFIVFKFHNKDIGLLRYERIQRINLHTNINKHEQTRYFLPYIKVNKSLGELLKNHIKYIGGSYDNIIEYKPTTQNSQVFVQDFLISNGINNDKLEKFYTQPTSNIMGEFQLTNELVKRITLLGVAIDNVIGNGLVQK